MRWQDIRRLALGGFRPTFSETGIIAVTTGKAVVEVGLPKDLVSARDDQGCGYISVVCFTNPCLFAVGPAKATFASINNMIYLPVNSTTVMRVDLADVSFYHLMQTAAGTLQVVVLK